MTWVRRRGILGTLNPLLGQWITTQSEGETDASGMVCTRHFSTLGTGWIELEARWQTGPSKEYLERAISGRGEAGQLTCFSFTGDGKKSVGLLVDASDVHRQAIAFEAQMPAGLARMVYWPLEHGAPGFQFTVESKSTKGWHRFLLQQFEPLV